MDTETTLQLDVYHLWTVLLRQKWKILLTVVAVLIPTCLYCLLTPPQYLSTVTLQVDQEAAKVVPYSDVSEGFVNAPNNFELYMKTKDAILRSPILARRTIRALDQAGAVTSPDLREELDAFDRHLQVERVEESQVVSLGFSSIDPEFAATVINTFAGEFLKLHFENKKDTTQKATEFLQEQLQALKTKLESAEKELIDYSRENAIAERDKGETDVRQDRFVFLSQQLSEIETRFMATSAKYLSLQDVSTGVDFPSGLKTANITDLEKSLVASEQELRTLLSQFDEGWPAVQALRAKIALVEEQLKSEKEAVLAQERNQAEIDYAAARKEYALVHGAIEKQKEEIDRLKAATITYNNLKREVATNEELYDGLLQRLKETGVTSGLEFGNIHILDPASPARRPYYPQLGWSLALAVVLGLALGIGLAFLLDFLNDKIAAPEDVEALGLWSLGYIPEFRPPKKAFLASRSLGINPGQEEAMVPLSRYEPEVGEAFQSLGASLLLSKGTAPPRSFLITSTVPQEGKSTVATYLARTMAGNGKVTALVDCDLRSRALSHRLGFSEEQGLTDYLSGIDSNLQSHVKMTETKNLYFVAAGSKAPNPIALLSSPRFGEFLSQLLENCQYVVIDSPPVLAVADAWLMATNTDGVVLVSKAGIASKKAVVQATSRICKSGADLLGIVINAADLSDPRYANNGYYHANYGIPDQSTG